MRSLIWFRRDFRVSDNPALFAAAEDADDGVIGLFVITPRQWIEHDEAGCKIHFWLRNLESLSHSLGKLNIPLRILDCDTFDEVPNAIDSFAKEHGISRLYFNREYEVNERRRDAEVVAQCETSGIKTCQFHDRVIVPPHKIKTKQDRFYSVFTPYRRVWDSEAKQTAPTLRQPVKQPDIGLNSSPIPSEIRGFDFSNVRDDLWEAGECAAHARLKKFQARIEHYQVNRDIPSVSGTSLLSPYLAAGVISPRQCLEAALAISDGTRPNAHGPTTWISELTWRDFYAHVLVGFPRVSMRRPFKLKTDAVRWRTNESDFAAWKLGQTGYPIVDAGMRQLNQTGWMHNRLRMVTAMFLTKHLLIDWRWGERYFMQHLVDGDLAANNGGWQWSASTGTDAVPYFRIFNPFSQSKRFDPDGKYIKQFCPELTALAPAALHDPSKLTAARRKLKLDYPDFVVDHQDGRNRALAEFKRIG